VIVNGEGITLADYQDELRRFQDANPNYSGDAQSFVLDDLINQMLLAQGAQEAGFEVDEAMLETRLTQLIDGVGGETAFSDWLEANHYTIESFKRALSRAIASAWMRDQIASSVPQEMEQVHARQILLADMNQAIEVVAQLESGKDFATLALVYDPIAMGDLGWFPRGYLADAKLEEAAFNLQPNEVSDIIETSMGYHLIQVIERDPARPLEPDALLVLQQKAVANWLEQRKAQSKVIINLP
jgi:parvulin-like peptidyl-prolyl isomerase